jgi:hypothetical protein
MRFPRLVLVFLALSWALVMLYPDPTVLVRSVRNTLRPRIQPRAVAALAARLPNNPRQIEAYVLNTQVPYAYDWQTSGVPWYFPTTSEALKQGSGDCESRAVVLASILAAKHIPYTLHMSLDHIWVDYPGKQANALENASVEVVGQRNGHFFIHWPAYVNVHQEIADQVAMYWTPAPMARRVLLFGGLAFIVLWNALAGLLAGRGLGRRNLAGAELSGERGAIEAGAAFGRRLRRRRSGARLATRPSRV